MIRPLIRTGTPSSDRIGGCSGGKPELAGCEPMSGTRSERPSVMISPRSPWPSGNGPRRRALLERDPARDEALDAPLVIDDAERRVVRTDQVADAIDDELEHGLDVELAGHGADGVAERLEGGAGGGLVGIGHVETVPAPVGRRGRAVVVRRRGQAAWAGLGIRPGRTRAG